MATDVLILSFLSLSDWPLALGGASVPRWRTELTFLRQLAVAQTPLPFPVPFPAPVSVIIATKPLFVLEDSLATLATVLGQQGAGHDSSVTRRSLLRELHTSTSVVPCLSSRTFESQEEHTPFYFDDHKVGKYFQLDGKIAEASYSASSVSTIDLQPVITLVDDQSVPDASECDRPEEDDPGNQTPTMSTLKETVVPETPPTPCKPSSAQFESQQEPSAETQLSVGERVLESWACAIVSLACSKSTVANSAVSDVNILNPLRFPAIEWKANADSKPPSPPPLPTVDNTLKTQGTKPASTTVLASSRYPKLKSLNLAGLGLTPAAPKHTLSTARDLDQNPVLPPMVPLNSSAGSGEILKLTACAEREKQMLEESDSEMDMPGEEEEEGSLDEGAGKHSGVNEELLSLHSHAGDSESEAVIDREMDGTPEESITLETPPQAVLTKASEEECHASNSHSFEHAVSPTHTDQPLEPPLKKLRLSEHTLSPPLTYTQGSQQDTKTYPSVTSIPEHSPTESADEGGTTGEQALPSESARLHSLVPVHCREGMGLDYDDRNDDHHDQRLEPVQLLQHNLQSLGLDQQHTAVVPDHTSYAVAVGGDECDDDTAIPKTSLSGCKDVRTCNRDTALFPQRLQGEQTPTTLLDGNIRCNLNQQIVPETTVLTVDPLGPFYNDTPKPGPALPLSTAKSSSKSMSAESRERKIRTRTELSPDKLIPGSTAVFQPHWSGTRYSSNCLLSKSELNVFIRSNRNRLPRMRDHVTSHWPKKRCFRALG